MNGMATEIGWDEIGVRLALIVVVGVALGYDRAEHGKAIGMRTTTLVGLAAGVAMIQVNLLMPTAGRPADSFIQNDLMRLPLGILTGVGFIGAGAILHRDSIVIGVTTAATLWLVTVIGLCLGGGQIGLGLVTAAIGILTLSPLRWLENRFGLQANARLVVTLDEQGPDERRLARVLEAGGLSIAGRHAVIDVAGQRRTFSFELRRPARTDVRDIVGTVSREPGVLKVEWHGPHEDWRGP